MNELELARQSAGVLDPTWSPPRSVPPVRTAGRIAGSIPVSGRGRRVGGSIGMRWRLGARASIVVPERRARAMLALLPVEAIADRYTLEEGTHLRLVEIDDPENDPLAADLATWCAFLEDSATWTLEIEDGPSTGVRVTLPADLGPESRYPAFTRQAALAIEALPDPGTPRPVDARRAASIRRPTGAPPARPAGP